MSGAVRRGGRVRTAAIAFGVAILVGALGGLATDIGPWYRGLVKPSWQPPDFLFGPVWTVLYVLIATSAVIGWHAAPGAAVRRWLLRSYVANAVLNVLWSVLFFAWQRPDWALMEVALLWASILVMMAVVRRASSKAAGMLLPYLAWVSFAAALNLAIVRLNGPFAGGLHDAAAAAVSRLV